MAWAGLAGEELEGSPEIALLAEGLNELVVVGGGGERRLGGHGAVRWGRRGTSGGCESGRLEGLRGREIPHHIRM